MNGVAMLDNGAVHGAKIPGSVRDGSVSGGGLHDVHPGMQQVWGLWGYYRTSRNLNMNY